MGIRQVISSPLPGRFARLFKSVFGSEKTNGERIMLRQMDTVKT